MGFARLKARSGDIAGLHRRVAATRLSAALLLLPAGGSALAGPTGCAVIDERVFAGDGETVRLAKGDGLPDGARVALFRAPLAVNTDGAPNSYHPLDFLGERLAINRLDNAIQVERDDGAEVSLAETIEVFEAWRDSGDWTPPAGYALDWQNVIAATPEGLPCVFSSGEHAGYFGSLTALQNGLEPDGAGECEAGNQLDQRFVPAIVLRGDDSPLRAFGARPGDLVLVVNPYDEAIAPVPAIVGDTGNGERIGEGSVALNMRLKGETRQPQIYDDVLDIDTDERQMIVAVIPGSARFRRERPYSAENIARRLEAWADENGYGGIAGMAALVGACAQGL